MIEAEGLTKDYDGVRALGGVTFQVDSGDVFALVGPNGAGKTTLLRMLTGILQPDMGSLLLFGQPFSDSVLARIGYMPEERGLYKGLTPLESVAYFARLKGLGIREARQASEEAIAAVGMTGHSRRKLEELSKGMAQRIQFAATIAHRPELLIFDEPFSGLDPVSTRFLQSVIQAQKESGRTILLSTHNMAHAETMCNRMLMLHRGRACLYGGVAEIKRRFTDGSVLVEHEGPLPELEGVRLVRRGETESRVAASSGTGSVDLLNRLVGAGARIRRFEPVEPSLEEIFVCVAGEEGEADLRLTLSESHA